MKTCILSGTLTAVEPIAVSPSGVAFYNDKKDAPKRLPRAGQGFSAPRYIPASTLRHVIRYGMASVILQALKASGREVPLTTVLALTTGFNKMKLSDKSNGKADKVQEMDTPQGTDSVEGTETLDDANTKSAKNKKKKGTESQKSASERLAAERRIRQINPLYAMVGAWGLPSELRVGNALPRGDRGETFAVAPEEVRKPLSDELTATLADDDLQQYEALLEEGASKDKKDTGIKYLGTGWEEIVAGTECDWAIHVHRATDLKVGAVLAALRAFASEPIIGAHKAVGRGEVALALDARFVDYQFLTAPQSAPAGDLKLSFGEFMVTGAMEQCLAVFDEQARAGFPDIDFNVIEVFKQDQED